MLIKFVFTISIDKRMSTLRNLVVLNLQLKSFSVRALSFKSSSNTSEQSQSRKVGAWLAVGLTAGAVSYYFYKYNDRTKEKFTAATQIRNDLPNFSIKKVAEQRYYIYGVGVYDLNNYAKNQHPGGEEAITDMVGKNFGEIWWREGMKFHEKKEILELLEGMRVGNFEGTVDKPERCKPTKVGEGPFCSVPQVDLKEYKLELALNNGTIVKALTLEELIRYPKHSIVSSIPCKSDPTKKEAGPTWTGVQLRDILQELKIKKTDYDEIRFECLDASSTTDKPYGTTVPIDRVLDEPSFKVLLAYEKDNTVISPQHGFPIRVVMPQAAGAKNVKWLKRIVLVKNND